MSGIAGVVRLDGGAVTAEQLQAMLAPMRRRGPDRRELACFGKAGFAQALLATTPEALAEVQPWRHPHSGCVVVSDSRLDHRPHLLRELGIADDAPQVNPNGGAIALGHPLGMSGARLVLTALHQLEKTGGRKGLATMCVGVGQGLALAIERIE